MASLLKKWFSSSRHPAADATYIALVAQARKPFFYAELGVPDTLDGRFEMIVLHLFFIQHRLLREPTQVEFARSLSESFFSDMDRSIRELGVADTGVAKRIKRMGQAYNGRLQVYEDGLQNPDAMRAALSRNLYGTVAEGTVEQLEAMRHYVEDEVTKLDAATTELIASGHYAWEEPAARK